MERIHSVDCHSAVDKERKDVLLEREYRSSEVTNDFVSTKSNE